jgi:hypothetical protein
MTALTMRGTNLKRHVSSRQRGRPISFNPQMLDSNRSYSFAPGGYLTLRQIGRLTIGRNINLTVAFSSAICATVTDIWS